MNKKLLVLLVGLLGAPICTIAETTPKPIIAVLDIEGSGLAEAESIAITNMLMSAAFDTGLVDVIDRNQRETILNEISFSLSDCADEKCALEVGKLLSADAMILGSITKISDRIAIDLKVLDVTTSKILGTFYKLYLDLNEILDNIDNIGGQLVQNFTGEVAQKKEVLVYEDLVPLVILCDVEDAKVSIDGASIGRITDGRIAKALNKNAEVLVVLEMEGYADVRQTVLMDEEKQISIEMKKQERNFLSVQGLFGGGTMGSLQVTVLPIPNWWMITVGVGFNVIQLEPIFLSIPLKLKTGAYLFLDEQSNIRPFAGLCFHWYLLKYTSDSSVLIDTSLEAWNLRFGIYAGAEVKLYKSLKAFGELSLTTNIAFDFYITPLQVGFGLSYQFISDT